MLSFGKLRNGLIISLQHSSAEFVRSTLLVTKILFAVFTALIFVQGTTPARAQVASAPVRRVPSHELPSRDSIGTLHNSAVTRSTAAPGVHALTSTAVVVSKPKHTKRQPKALGVQHRYNTGQPELLHTSTTVANGAGEIHFSLELGAPYRVLSHIVVRNAPHGRSFSHLAWSNLDLTHAPHGTNRSRIASAGMPDIPALAMRFAIPEGADGLTLDVSGRFAADLHQVYLLPVVQPGDSLPSFTPRYGGAHKFDARITAPITFRTTHFVTLLVPLAEITSDGSIRARESIKGVLHFHVPASVAFTSAHSRDPLFASAASALVANPRDLPQFSVAFHPGVSSAPRAAGGKLSAQNRQPLAPDSTRTFDLSVVSWIDTKAPYAKISVTRTGLYRVTAQEIVSRTGSTQLDLTQWHPNDARLMNHGHEVPIWIDSTADGHIAAIEFYGERMPGFPGEYYNVATDTNCYWLTNSHASLTPPLRFKPKYVTASAGTPLTTGTVEHHHERDRVWYPGNQRADQDDSRTIQRTEWIPGRRFVWTELSAPNGADTNRLVDTTILHLPTDTAGKTAQFNAFIAGIAGVEGSGTLNHRARMLVNGAIIADTLFSVYDSIVVKKSVPLGLLHDGQNIIQILSVGTTNPLDDFYVDFYSLTLTEALVPSNDTSIATGQLRFVEQLNAGTQAMTIVANDNVQLFNLSDTARLVRSNVQGGVTTLRDSTSGGSRDYAATTATALLHADQIYGWNVGVPGHDWAILDTTRGTDYIVITHPLFQSTASKLQFLRQQSGVRTQLVSTDEVFNAFNYGSNEPWSIKQFLHYAYDYDHGVPPGFVTLLGDATWDPKHNLSTTTHNSFVPSFGQPVSDFVFTTLEGSGPDSLVPEMVIARISVETPDQADAYYRKLLDYSTAPPAAWNKRFLFVAGGDGPGGQHSVFMDQIQGYLQFKSSGAIQQPPMTISPRTIERTDFRNVDFTHEADIQEQLREGCSIFYFAGHGSPIITDISLGNPEQIRNNGPYPALISLSCRTGAFGENDVVALSETYLRAADQGAIITYGTSGFGDLSYDDILSQFMWNLMDAADTDKSNVLNGRITLSTVFTLSKVATSLGAPTSPLVDLPLNSINQYLILGDAMLGFALRPNPELSIVASDIVLTDRLGNPKSSYTLADSAIDVHATVHNFGYSTRGAVLIRIRDVGPHSGATRDVFVHLDRLDSTAQVGAEFPVDSNDIGQHQFSVFVDADSLYPAEAGLSKLASAGALVTGASVTTLYPAEGARGFCEVTSDSINLVLLPPAVGSQASANGKLEIEVDTTSTFTNARAVGTIVVTTSPVLAHLPKNAIPISASHVIWLRTRFTSQGASTPGQWVVMSVSTDQSTAPSFSYTTPDQLRTTIVDHLTIGSDGLLQLPKSDTVPIEVLSHGGADSTDQGNTLTSHVFVGKADSSITGPYLVIVVLSVDQTTIEDYSVIRAPDLGNDSENAYVARIFDSIVRPIPNGRKVIIFANQQPEYTSPHTPFIHDARVREDMFSLGARTGFDSTTLFGSYAIIGVKGAPIGSAKEGSDINHGAGVLLHDTVITFATSGHALTPSTAIASHYGRLSWTGSGISRNADIIFTVIGHNRLTGIDDTLQSLKASSAASWDLSSIDARTESSLSTLMHFVRDSSTASSPELSSISLEYLPAPEVAIDADSFVADPGSVSEGYPVRTTYVIRNLTCVPVVGLTSQTTQVYHSTTSTPFTHSNISLGPHEATTVVDTFQTFGLNGRVDLTASANPGELISEQFLLNDQASTFFTVGRDTTKPTVDVTFDGRHAYNCDYVSSHPLIEIAINDVAPTRLTDSTAISALLRSNSDPTNPIYLSSTQTNTFFNVQFVKLASGSLQAKLIAKPNLTSSLAPDTWTLTAYAKDASGNTADTISICFTIARANGLDHVMNVPNPFKDQTSMTYQLRTGGVSDVKIVIYTIAGRKIRTLLPDPATPPHAGLNFMMWDGRDEAGNLVANGTYLYRVVLNGQNEDGTSASDAVTERAVKSK